MATEQGVSQVGGSGAALDAEVIVIGAGVSGIYQLHLLREAGFDVRLVEAGTNVGGTWYWNRYPGARFDSESYSYGYFFSPELLAEWDWSEHFAGQAETEAYLNFVVEKLGLRDLMQFRTRIASATFDEPSATGRSPPRTGRSFVPASWCRPPACCRCRTGRRSPGASGIGARRTTRASGRRSRSTSPARRWR